MKDKSPKSDRSHPNAEFSLETLARKSGITERSIRYYIARGLLNGPARGGRGAFYTNDHLTRLEEILDKQRRGMTLGEIERSGERAAVVGALPEPETWWAYPISSDVVVQVRSGASPWRLHQIRTTLARLAHELSPR